MMSNDFFVFFCFVNVELSYLSHGVEILKPNAIHQVIAQVRVNGSYKFKIEKMNIKGFAPTPFISIFSGA